MFFHALTFAGSLGSYLNTRPLGGLFKHGLRDPASVNETNMCDRYSCIFYLNSAYIALKTSLKH